MSMQCPRCRVGVLEEIEADGVVIDRCVICAGLWFDQGELLSINEQHEPVRVVESSVPDSAFEVPTMPCPRCRTVNLRESLFSGDTGGKVVYRCASCLGSWIDRGELRLVEDIRLVDTIRQTFR